MNVIGENAGGPLWPAQFNYAPKWAVDREDLFDLELERVFQGPVWHLVAHVSELAEPGRFKTVRLGRTPLLVVHGADGVVRAMHNACAHRGTLVEPRFRGVTEHFECPFHRWAYGLDGSLERCPGEKDFPAGFARGRFGLVPVRSASLLGLVFVTLGADTPDLDEWLGEAGDDAAAAVGGDGRLRLLGYQKVVFDANWKIYIDDEGYHAPLLHKAFQLLRWQGGSGSQTRTVNGHRITATYSEGGAGRAELIRDTSLIRYRGGERPRNKHPRQQAGSLLVTPWPLGAIMNHLDIINIRFANPISARQTEVHYAYFAHQDDDPEMVRHRLRQSSNLIGPSGFISLEDGAVFGRIQKAIHSEPPTTHYLRGWRHGDDSDPYRVSHNDETTNAVWWEMYRRTMGFPRSHAPAPPGAATDV